MRAVLIGDIQKVSEIVARDDDGCAGGEVERGVIHHTRDSVYATRRFLTYRPACVLFSLSLSFSLSFCWHSTIVSIIHFPPVCSAPSAGARDMSNHWADAGDRVRAVVY